MNISGTAGLAVLTAVYLRYEPQGASSTVYVDIENFVERDWISVLPAVGTGFFGISHMYTLTVTLTTASV